MSRILMLAVFAAMLSGCASAPKVYKVESVYICAAEECGQAAQNYGVEQVLSGLEKLLEANSDQTIKFCEADAKTHECKSADFCHYVQGGPFPGSGCLKTTTVVAPHFDSADKHIQFKTSPSWSFLGLPLVVAPHQVDISARSINEIVWKDEAYYTNWMVVGNQTNNFSFAVDFIDLDRGILGGYWSHTATGTGSGSGSGYGLMTFPKAMPVTANWLDDSEAQPVRSAAVQQAVIQGGPPALEDKKERLRELKQLREQGLITDEVYAAKQNEILNGL